MSNAVEGSKSGETRPAPGQAERNCAVTRSSFVVALVDV